MTIKTLPPIEVIPDPELNQDEQSLSQTEWESEHPLFMTKIPEVMNENVMALQELKYGLSTPDALADSFKEEGNAFFRRGKMFYHQAIKCYTKALAEKINDPERTTIYLCNRAAVNFELENYRSVIEDCQEAIKTNPKNVKVYFRAAKAAARLDQYENSIRYINESIAIEPENQVLIQEKVEIEKLKAAYEVRMKSIEKRRQRLADETAQALEVNKKWVQKLHSRDIAIGPYAFQRVRSFLTQRSKPYIDTQNNTHWPVLFLYDEYMQMDLIEDFMELDTFENPLQIMFPKDSYCDWDKKREYTSDKAEIYTVLNHVPAFISKHEGDPKRPRKVKINPKTCLRKVLEHPEYVVPGCPIFYVVISGSKFKDEFLKRRIDIDSD